MNKLTARVILKVFRMTKTINKCPDWLYLKLIFRLIMDQNLDLKNPKTFNQKLQWLKLYDRNPEYCKMVDKYEVKKFVADRIGEQYIIPTLGVWNRFDDIDFDTLPNQFVLKCTHDSGGLVICRDKSTFDIEKARAKVEASLNRNYFWSGREWPYKNVKPRIIAEKYMEDASGGLMDYKFFCFDGVADNVMVVADRAINDAKYYHFSKDWHILHYNRLCRKLPDDFQLPKPPEIDEMFALAERMGAGIPHVRVDFYLVDGQIYFGEYTFYSEGGMETGYDEYSDGHLGSLLKLPPKRR